MRVDSPATEIRTQAGNPADALRTALRRITRAMHLDPRLESLLPLVTREIRVLLDAEGASVILHDPQTDEFFFPAAAYTDAAVASRFAHIRFASHQGAAGQVFKSGEPLVVADAATSPFFLQAVDDQSGFHTRNMLDVPLWAGERCIGVLREPERRRELGENARAAILKERQWPVLLDRYPELYRSVSGQL